MITIADVRALPAEITNQQDTQTIADALSAGRVRLVPTEIGNGLVLETVGLDVGNALLDVIYNAPDFRYVKPLLEQGRLDIGSPLARAALDSLVGVVAGFEQAHADAIKALAEASDQVSEMEVRRLCWSDEGVWQV